MEAGLQDSSQSLLFRKLVAFYTQEDASGTVERAHSIGKHLLQNHAGPLEGTGATYNDLLALRLDGPQKPDTRYDDNKLSEFSVSQPLLN